MIKEVFKKNDYIKVFFLSFFVAIITLVPIIIADGGVFIYGGDYVYQQIPFYRHANEIIKSGKFFWDWKTDLGSNFIGAYSFSLIGSLFFWITMPFKSTFVIYIMPIILCLKTSIAAVTSYIYISRFVSEKNGLF